MSASQPPKKPNLNIDTGKETDNKKEQVETLKERLDRINKFKAGGNRTRTTFNAIHSNKPAPKASDRSAAAAAPKVKK